MKKHLFASLAVATTIGFFTPLSSQAFGLGKLELKSALNEPFKAEIDVTALKADEKDNLQVQIASNDEFERAGLSRSMLLNQLKFDIVEHQGQTKILVTSVQAVKEPFLDFLLTATTGQGRLIREYTVLLDPPEYVMAETRNVTAAPVAKPTVAVGSKPSVTRYQYDAGSQATSYAVQRSDTLWDIALKTRPVQDISVHQMMMALLNANPDAFTNQNINGLRAGHTLQIPSSATIRTLTTSEAIEAVKRQNELWKNRNKKPAVSPAIELEQDTSVQSEQTADTTAGTDTGDTAAVDAESAQTAETDARLQLVTPEDEGSQSPEDADAGIRGNDQVQALTEQLTMAQETIEAQAQENLDFKARMDAMEEQLETMRRLIAIKDSDMARLQSTLESDEAGLTAEIAVDAGTDDTAEVSTESVVTDMPEEGVITDTAKALNLDPQEVESVISKAKQLVVENKLESALAALLVLLVLGLIARRRNRAITWDEAVESTEQTTTVVPESKSFESESEVETEIETITDAPLNEVREKTAAELIEQADMFVGYADYAQARTALEQALSQESNNMLVVYKLLFVLYKQQRGDDFVALIDESGFDSTQEQWEEVSQWGSELLPGNPLFVEQPVEIEVAETEAETESVTVAEQGEEEVEAETHLNMPDEMLEETPSTAEEIEPIEFNLEDFADTAETEAVSTGDKENEPVKEDVLEFDTHFDLDEKVTEAEEELSIESLDLSASLEEEPVAEALTLPEEEQLEAAEEEEEFATLSLPEEEEVALDEDEPDLDFNIGDLDDIDEAETKLDLASAYIDMGDPDGARNILNEVLIEGNEEQKNRAHELLDSLN